MLWDRRNTLFVSSFCRRTEKVQYLKKIFVCRDDNIYIIGTYRPEKFDALSWCYRFENSFVKECPRKWYIEYDYSAILRNFTLIFAKTVEMLQLSDLSLKSCILIILTGMIFHVCDTCNVSSQEWSNRKITAVIAMQSENCNAKTSRCHDSTNNTNRETVSKSGNDSVIEQL